ncbi:pyocin activator PrtN family protein [Luteibacter sp. 22Crub2.1]|uniref:pyocin activator PrtN family protein n=1 Tax=Luteibacter sp. 22Crub2.1 TaxID=1283288 RepID=UPI0009A6981B|nr:pyocin activator PrtN family protein [Luteibacter sp. 22Crub2.1]SKB69447.1 Pyocin activator protein PrtN [Luteibacter sp. 22Crub2.1]
MKTFFALMAEYSTANIPLEHVCHLFGLGTDEAAKRASRHQLPVPAYRASKQKSPWIVDAHELAKYLDSLKIKAADAWGRVRGLTG